MNESVFQQLFKSFFDLENAITVAKEAVAKEPKENTEVLTRLGTYEDILVKQRSLALNLCDHVAQNDWPQVARHVTIINGLSKMIRDDAREIVAKTSTAQAPSVSPDDFVQ